MCSDGSCCRCCCYLTCVTVSSTTRYSPKDFPTNPASIHSWNEHRPYANTLRYLTTVCDALQSILEYLSPDLFHGGNVANRLSAYHTEQHRVRRSAKRSAPHTSRCCRSSSLHALAAHREHSPCLLCR